MKHVLALAGALSLSVATAAVAEQVLVFAGASSERSVASRQFTAWAERVNADGAGIIRIDYRPGMALANPSTFYDRVSDGVVDISWGILTQISGQFPRLSVLELPFMVDSVSTEDIMPFSLSVWDLYTSGLLDPEFEEVVPLFVGTFAQSPIHLSAPLENLDSLGGRRIIGGGPTYAASITALGGVPLSIGAGDSYEAVQRGTADGRIMSWTAVPAFRFDEITSYHAEVPLGTAPGSVIINRSVYEGLSPEAREILDRHTGEVMVREMSELWIRETAGIRQRAIDAGSTVVSPTPEQLADWRDRTGAIRDAWVAATPDGAEVLSRFQVLVAQHRGQ